MSQFSQPAGSNAGGKRTLADVAKFPKDVYPVGRLDYDSEGLLILTNDAALNQRLLDPKNRHEREYWVQVEGLITEAALGQLRGGLLITVDGKQHPCRAAEATRFRDAPEVAPRVPPIRFRKAVPDSWISLVLTEGKNRQVRKMTAATGFPTLRLIRYRIQQLTIATMTPGSVRSFSREALFRLLFS